MKNLLLRFFYLTILCSISLTDCLPQSVKASKFNNELLVFIMRDSLDLPSSSIGIERIRQENFKSKKLLEVLSSLDIVGIAKAFPEWNDSDSISISKENKRVKKPEFGRIFRIVFNSEKEAKDAIPKLKALKSVLFAEPNSKPRLFDEYTNGTQWFLNNDGRNGGIIGADINADVNRN